MKKIYKLSQPYRDTLGKNIQTQRKKKKLSLRDLAKKIGRTSNTIVDYEKGRISPSVLSLFLIAQALDISTHALLWKPGVKK